MTDTERTSFPPDLVELLPAPPEPTPAPATPPPIVLGADLLLTDGTRVQIEGRNDDMTANMVLTSPRADGTTFLTYRDLRILIGQLEQANDLVLTARQDALLRGDLD